MKTSHSIFLASAIGLPALQLSAHPMHQHDTAAFERVRQSIPANLPEDMQVILRQLFSPDRRTTCPGLASGSGFYGRGTQQNSNATPPFPMLRS